MTGETVSKATEDVIDHNYDGVIMLGEDAVYFNDAQPRPDGRKIYHIFEQCPSSKNDETEEEKPKVDHIELFSKASENSIQHIREVLACNGILYDEWCPPITPLTENLNILCQKEANEDSGKKKVTFSQKLLRKKAQLIRSRKWCKNGKENFQNGKKMNNTGKEINKQNNNHESSLLSRAKIAKSRLVKLQKEEQDPLYIPEEKEKEKKDDKKETVYRCSKCSFWTEKKNILKYHQITHLDRKVLSCSFCSFKTNYKNSLKGHLLTAHDLSQEKCIEEISKVQNIITVLDSEEALENSEPQDLNENVLEKSPISPEENVREKYVRSIRLKKEIGNENGEIPSYNIVEKKETHSNNICNENVNKLKLPDAKVVLIRLSPEMVAVYTQQRSLKLTITKLEKEKKVFTKYKINKIKKGFSIRLSKQEFVYKKKSKYCNIKALRYKKWKQQYQKVPFPMVLNCSHCNFKTRRKRLLRHHIFRYHDMVYSCVGCSYTFLSKYELEKHIRSHKEYRCKKCDYTSNSKFRLRKHESSSHLKSFSCESCVFLCSTEEEYLQHILKHIKPMKPKKKNIYKCFYCPFICDEKKELNEHGLSHLDVDPFRCKYCSFSTDNEFDLTEHNLAHPQRGFYRCSKCKYRSKIKASVRQHELSHLKTKMLKCTQCDYSTNYKGNLRNHEINNHTEDKQYKCDKCDYSSQFQKYLELHSISHMEGEVLKCFFCDFISDLKTGLRTHIIDHHHTHGPKRSRMTNKNNIKQEYSCDVCDFTTNSRTGFNQHKKTHLSVKEYKCHQCSYATNFKGNLLKHRLVHTNVDPLAL